MLSKLDKNIDQTIRFKRSALAWAKPFTKGEFCCRMYL